MKNLNAQKVIITKNYNVKPLKIKFTTPQHLMVIMEEEEVAVIEEVVID